MNAQDVLAKLRDLGKPQTAAIYKRHGSGDNVYGVVTGDIGKLKKKIKMNHALAMELWNTGNIEARVLALQIADPAKLSRADADRLLREGQAHFLACYLSELVARSPVAAETMQAWMKLPDEDAREVGYGILGFRLKADPDSVSDAEAEEIVGTIEEEIHSSPNWARYAMNSALISIGVNKPELSVMVLAVAERIGSVEIDHGETTCKTPDAVAYIEKGLKRKLCP